MQVAGYGQDRPVSPTVIRTGVYLGETPPLRDIPPISDEEYLEMVRKAEEKALNPKLRHRSYPYAATALPKGPDPVWQRSATTTRNASVPLSNFAGQNSPYYPSDANGTIGPNYYMQTVNTTYAIYNRSGQLMAGPTNLNTLFSGVPGSSCNNGDPIVLYDEQASRWLVAEFSLCDTTDFMLVAVSTTNDPTGTWHKYSFNVDDVPDYMKFGVWQDGYYMGTNTFNGDDIYVFERSQMLNGLTAQMVGFDNPWRPSGDTAFVCVPPLDNDGDFAPAGSPGVFIAFNDDAIGGGSDELWIYELDVDWTTPANSTFDRVQQIAVASFDSDFGLTWNNISQPVTTSKLDAIPQVIMNPPQYRNFGSHQTIVCCHTVDVDNTDHAGIRWYELRKTTGNWTVRQQGTYAPDEHSRWMGSIVMNEANEIALGYSISSTSVYPGLRYCGQTAAENDSATGILDFLEGTIQTGSLYQSGINRWGDYSAMSVDPNDDETFWFTSQYVGPSTRATRIASLQIGLDANFSASTTIPTPGSQVDLTDLSNGNITSWNWTFNPNTVTFLNGTTDSSQNPQVSFDNPGYYTVSLTIANNAETDSVTRTNYIHVFYAGLWHGTTSTSWTTASNWDGSIVPNSTFDVTIPADATRWPTYSGSFTAGTQCKSLTLSGSAQMTVAGNFTINPGSSVTVTDNGQLSISGNWTNNGDFDAGTGTVIFTGSGASTVAGSGNIAGITNYRRTTMAKNIVALTGATVGPTGNDGSATVPIGFTFNYLNTANTQAVISTNGWLSFIGTTELGNENVNLFTPGEPNATIAPWWDDLSDDYTSVVRYKTSGTAPNRVFSAEWRSILSYYTGASSRLSFMLKLYETTNVIEFHYGSVGTGTHNANESASMGIEDFTGGSGHFIDGKTGSKTTGTSTLKSVGNWPTSNIRFTPPVFTENFYNVVLNKSSNNVNFSVSANVAGSFTVSPGSTFTVGTGKEVKVNGVGEMIPHP